ncbi:hypothetical protein H632_c5p5, partial [Helicosporidium sp. ATCC 50920]
ELLPEKRMLTHPNLAKAVGSDFLAARLRLLRPAAHTFGHTHFSWDTQLADGVRYVQWPLGYPVEQRKRAKTAEAWKPLLLFDSEQGGLTPARHCYWSAHYEAVSRDPYDVRPAPWVTVR